MEKAHVYIHAVIVIVTPTVYMYIVIKPLPLIIGTIPYMAPELFKPAKRTAAVDIYALGCVMIEAYGKQRVWPGLNRTDIIQKMVGSYQTPHEMPSTSHLSCDFGGLCRRCCSLQPTERPAASEILQDLQELIPIIYIPSE